MSVLISNLNTIESVKLDIKSAIEAKGVSMSGVSFPDYPAAIGSISGGGGGITEEEITEKTYNIVTLNNSASYVGSYAFALYNSLTTVNLPNCSSIYTNAFRSCYSLNSVSIPICKSIGNYGFAYCSSLPSLDLPECTYLGDYAFTGCTLLSSISLPVLSTINGSCTFYVTPARPYLELPLLMKIDTTSTTWITATTVSLCRDVAEVPSFANNTQLNFNSTTSIYVPSETYNYFRTVSYWSAFAAKYVSFPHTGSEPLISIDNGMVYGSTMAVNRTVFSILGITKQDVTELSLQNCKYINDNNGVFESCTSLTSVNLPACEYVGSSAFQGCTSLSYVNLPVCSSIGNLAFYINRGASCSLILGSNSVVTVGGGQPINYSGNVSVYVPASLVDAYKSAENWSTYSNKIFPIPEP